ncbi:uncharacterized protein TNCV_3554221 [Trichonephila clavipes]|nr:uncharacterized protein TNCV_3554221 [Trichonephila clavipes]
MEMFEQSSEIVQWSKSIIDADSDDDINSIRDLAVSEIWILTDSRSSIQHLSNWPSISDSTSRSVLHRKTVFKQNIAIGSAPYSSTVAKEAFQFAPNVTSISFLLSTFCNVWSFPVRRLLPPPAVLRLCTDLWTHGSGSVSLDQMGISPTTTDDENEMNNAVPLFPHHPK